MDRKAWIVIILCCLGLAVNLHYSRKNRESLVERERERQAEQAAKAVANLAVGEAARWRVDTVSEQLRPESMEV